MDRLLRDAVWQRAQSCCEYCGMPQEFTDAGHEVDHIIAEKHAGPTALDNLALACFPCNNHKGPCIAGFDSDSQQIVRLFHPRQDRWSEHFAWQGPVVGLTPIGRVTVEVLAINLSHRIAHRQALLDEGVFPPASHHA